MLDEAALREIMPGLTMMIGGLMPALAIGWIGSKAMEAIGRNPEAAPRLQTIVILLVAFVEAIAIYSLVLALVLKFA